MKKSTKRQHKGFSLIELVIVVAIIGILALMIIPQFNNVTKDAKYNTWKSNCQSVVSAIGIYQAGHNGDAPASTADLAAYISSGFPLDNSPSHATYKYEANSNGDMVFTSTFPNDDSTNPAVSNGTETFTYVAGKPAA